MNIKIKRIILKKKSKNHLITNKKLLKKWFKAKLNNL